MTADHRKNRLCRLELVYVRSPIYFITICTSDRRKVLASEAIHQAFIHFGLQGPIYGAWVGNYVLKDNDFRVDEVFKKFDLENVAATERRCTALAKDVFRSSATKQRVVLRKMELRSRKSGAGGIGEHCRRVELYGRGFSIGVPRGLVVFGGHRPPLQQAP